jgi:hypothetical protein
MHEVQRFHNEFSNVAQSFTACCVAILNAHMFRLLHLVLVMCILATAASCSSQCKRMSKTNAKLIAGNHDFGKGKESKKYKRLNRR